MILLCNLWNMPLPLEPSFSYYGSCFRIIDRKPQRTVNVFSSAQNNPDPVSNPLITPTMGNGNLGTVTSQLESLAAIYQRAIERVYVSPVKVTPVSVQDSCLASLEVLVGYCQTDITRRAHICIALITCLCINFLNLIPK